MYQSVGRKSTAPVKMALRHTPTFWPFVAAHGVRRNRVIFRADSVRPYIHCRGAMGFCYRGGGRGYERHDRSTGIFSPRPYIHQDSIGDGREEKAFSPSPHGKVNAVNAAMWGGWRIACSLANRREGCIRIALKQKPPARVLNPNPLSEHPLRANAREREFLLDDRIPRAFAHLPHRKGHRWRRRRRPGSGGNPAFVHSCSIR